MLVEIRLHGDLKDFGPEWHLNVHTPMEAAQAINANSPGFMARLQSGRYSVVALPKGVEVTDAEQVEVMDTERCGLPISSDLVLHFIPIPEGDLESVIYWVGYALFSIGVPQGLATLTAVIIVTTAVTFALVGIANLLMPAPPGEGEADPSYYFSGPVNSARQGAPVPVLYGGPLLVGSQVIGQSIVAENLPNYNSRSTASVEIIDAISEGVIEGFANADLESSVFLDKVAYRRDGVDNFEGFEVDYTLGTQDQDFKILNISGSPGTASVLNVNQEIKPVGLVRALEDPNVGRVGITFNIPRLVWTQSDGDINPAGVGVRVYIKGVGQPSYQEVIFPEGQWIASDGHISVSPAYIPAGYFLTKKFDILPSYGASPFDLKIERIGEASTHPRVTNNIYWASFTQEIISNLSYPNTAYAVTKFDAQQFGAIPGRGFLMKGLLVEVPSNYDPVTRTYDPEGWDGNFKPDKEWTNNPAWIFRDLALNERYGLGKYVTADLVNKWALYTIARYCDELVEDGYSIGGQEPRFTCNLYLQTRGEAFTVLKQLASSFRSILYWNEGQVTLNQDAPKVTSGQYTSANVIGGKFNYSGTPKHTRYTVALVTYINPEDNYNSAVEYVEDHAGILLYGVNELSLTAVGCSSRGQANRTGKYALLTSRLETDAVSFRVGLDGLGCTPGDVIKIIDPLHNLADESVGGRIASSATLSSVVLDRPVILAGGTTYSLTVTMPDASQSAHQIANGAGTVTPPTAISFNPALAVAPVSGAIWSITDDAESERLYRVLSVAEGTSSESSGYDISGVRFIPTKLADADSPGAIEDPDVPPYDDGISPPAGLLITEGVVPILNGMRRYLDLSWSAPTSGFISHYQVTVEGPTTSQTYAVYATDYRLFDIVPGVYTITVRAVNIAGQVSTGISKVYEVEELAPIDLLSITGLELIGQGNDTEFVGRSPEFVWRLTSALTGDFGDETFGGDTGIADPWFRDYEVTVYDENGNVLRTDTTVDRHYVYLYERNQEDGGPRRTVGIGVRVRDIFNRTSDETFIEVTNPPPGPYYNVVTGYGIELITVKFQKPSDPDFVSTRVYVSTTPAFTKDAATLAYEGPDIYVQIANLPEPTYYISLEGVDAFGPSGTFTDEIQVDILSISRLQDQLAGEITEGWLYQDLNDRIDLIDVPGGLVDLVNQNIADIDAIGGGILDAVNTFFQPSTSPPADPSEGDLWFKTDENNHPYRYNGTTLEWESVNNSQDVGVIPYIQDDEPGPAGLVTGDIWIDTDDNDRAYEWDGDSWEPLLGTSYLLTAAIAVERQIRVESDMLAYAEYSIKVDINGHIAGIGLGVSGGASGPIRSQVIVLADQFAVGFPTTEYTTGYTYGVGDWVTPSQQFIADNGADEVQPDGETIKVWDYVYRVNASTANTTLEPPWPEIVGNTVEDWNGSTLFETFNRSALVPFIVGTFDANAGTGSPPDIQTGIVMSSAYIGVASIDSAHIRDLSVTTAHVFDLDVSVLAAGIIDVDGFIYLGGDSFKLSSADQRLTVSDNQFTPVERVELGSLSNGGYGIIIRDDAGDIILSSGGTLGIGIDNSQQQWSDIQGVPAATLSMFYAPTDPGTQVTGDYWIDSDDNKMYRWNGTSWDPIQDADVTNAFNLANDALTTADGKIVSFAQDEPPTADGHGDIWMDTNDDNRIYRWDALLPTPAWVPLTQDTAAWAKITDKPDTFVQIFYDTNAPTGAADGDLWVHSTTNLLSRWNGATWDPIQDDDISTALATAIAAADVADGKIVTFAQDEPPTADGHGDIWMDTDNDNLIHRWDSLLPTPAWVPLTQDTASWAKISDKPDEFVQIFYDAIAPPTAAVGDLWVHSTTNVLSRYALTGWEEIQDTGIQTALDAAGDAAATADGKIISFAQDATPTATAIGDIWMKTDEDNKISRWSGAAWVPLTQDTADWSKVFGTGVPDDFATQNLISASLLASPPMNPSEGDIWYQTDTAWLMRHDGVDWEYIGNGFSDTSQLFDGANLGDTALWSNIFGQPNAPANNADVTEDSRQSPSWLTDLVVWSGNQIDNTNIGTYMSLLAVKEAYIDDLAVSSAKIQDAAIDSAKIADLAVDNAKIADLAVDTAKIENASIETLKIADDAVTVPSSVAQVGYLSPTGWETICSVTWTASGYGKIIAWGGCKATSINSAYSGTAGLRVVIGGNNGTSVTEVLDQTTTLSRSMMFNAFHERTVTAGSITVELQIYGAGSGVHPRHSAGWIIVVEAKR